MIYGFLGNIAAGKTIAARYCAEKVSGSVLSFSTGVKTLCTKLGLEHSRTNMVAGGNVVREMFGGQVWVEYIRKEVKKYTDQNIPVFIDDIRFIQEVDYVLEEKGKLFYLYSSIGDLFDRVVARNKNGDNYNSAKAFGEFLKDCDSEELNFDLRRLGFQKTTQYVEYKGYTFDRPYVINNTGTKQKMFDELDCFITNNIFID